MLLAEVLLSQIFRVKMKLGKPRNVISTQNRIPTLNDIFKSENKNDFCAQFKDVKSIL
jgi:hypothetical protein